MARFSFFMMCFVLYRVVSPFAIESWCRFWALFQSLFLLLFCADSLPLCLYLRIFYVSLLVCLLCLFYILGQSKILGIGNTSETPWDTTQWSHIDCQIIRRFCYNEINFQDWNYFGDLHLCLILNNSCCKESLMSYITDYMQSFWYLLLICDDVYFHSHSLC